MIGSGERARDSGPKPATSARIYDYYLGGIHNFPADREAARELIAKYPFLPAAARANRAFLRRVVRYLAGAGVRQFLDIGSGIPTEGNIHEIAQEVAPESRVVYVDIDPDAVAESLEILEGNERATAVRADLRSPGAIVEHRGVRRMLDFDQPVGLLLVAVLHFVPDDAEVYDAVAELVAALCPGSYLVATHAAAEAFLPGGGRAVADSVYRRQTSTPGAVRDRSETERFFTGLELVDPGVVWLHEWRPDPDDPAEFSDDPRRGGMWVGVGRKA